ncbi:MAG: hypothetical protein R6U61_07245 [Thermoplasmata archaeon]
MRKIQYLVVILLCISIVSPSLFTSATETVSHNKSENPMICIYNGCKYIVWEESDEEGDTDIMFKNISDPRGRSYSIPDEDEMGEDRSPFLIEYKSKLYCIWITDDNESSVGDDKDVVLRAYDGGSWGDIIDVSTFSRSESSDDSSPKAVVFRDSMHIFWSNGTHLLTRSFDGDELSNQIASIGKAGGVFDVERYGDKLYAAYTYRTISNNMMSVVKSYDGAWSDFEVEYNPGNDARDYAPDLEVYKDKLYIAWVTTDKSISSGDVDDDVVIRSYDESKGSLSESKPWSNITELSGFEVDHQDIWPVMTVFDDKLYVFWQTWNVETHSGNMGDDIGMRYYNGKRWSDFKAVTDDEKHDGGIYHPGIQVTSTKDELLVCWQSRENKKYGDDWKIYYDVYDSIEKEDGGSQLNPYIIPAALIVMITAVIAYIFIRKKKD